MVHRFFKVFLFIIIILLQYIAVYAEEETFRDGKEWKELNIGLIEESKDGNLSKVKELLSRGAIISTKKTHAKKPCSGLVN